MGGTPQCIEDTRRGVYSYEALRSRLAEGRFAQEGMRDMLAPVIHLNALTNEELLVLTEKLTEIHAQLFGYTPTLTQEDRILFLQIEFGRIGADSHITPREVIRDFIELLDIIFQNPQMHVAELLQSDQFSYAAAQPEGDQSVAPEFAEFDICLLYTSRCV